MSKSSTRRYRQNKKKQRSNQRSRFKGGCVSVVLATFLFTVIGFIVLSAYLFFPQRKNLLLLGLDYSDPKNVMARSDTIILSTFVLPEGYLGLFSIPRDLLVNIPGFGNNRINTAHFFSEVNQPGTGPSTAMATIESNFGVDVDYYVRLRFQGLRDVVDAMGGLDIELDRPMAGYETGKHHLTGRKTLAFTRSRSGSDDFIRMERGQLVLKSIYKQMLSPFMWFRLPGVISAFTGVIDTNVPAWQWPRIGFVLLRSGVEGIDSRTMTREMTTPYITETGANVLLPRWELINPVLYEIFEQ